VSVDLHPIAYGANLPGSAMSRTDYGLGAAMASPPGFSMASLPGDDVFGKTRKR
jgi:hypothetical protein